MQTYFFRSGVISAIIASITFFSCNKESEAVEDETAILTFFESKGLVPQTDVDGLYYVRLSPEGGSLVSVNDVVGVSYILSYLSGGEIERVTFTDQGSQKMLIGSNTIYPFVVEEGIRKMRLDEEFLMVIPAANAYQNLDLQGISPDESLVLELKLESAQSLAQMSLIERQGIINYINARNLNDTIANPLNTVRQLQGGLFYKRLASGNGNIATNGDTLLIDARIFKIPSGDEVANLTNYRKIVGEDVDFQGFESALRVMQSGERALFLLPSSLAYQESVFVFPNSLIAELALKKIVPGYAAQISPFSSLGLEIHVKELR
jgi:FKBP-type peptidyl-prolyl cis-trans isomerase